MSWPAIPKNSFSVSMNHDDRNFKLATCAERIDLSEYGIEHNRCIDPELISHLAPDDVILQNFLYNEKTDSGQRKACGCILSKDIGAYNTNYKKSIANPLTDSII